MTRQFLEPYVNEARDRMTRLEVAMVFGTDVNHARARELGEAYGKAWRQYERIAAQYHYSRVIPRPQLRTPAEAA